MYRLLRLIFIGTWELPKRCEHTYEVYSVDYNDYNKYITSRCSKCGKMYTHSVV